MLTDLNWDKIEDTTRFELRGMAEQYSEERTYHILLIGPDNVGKSTLLDNLSTVELRPFKRLPTLEEDITLSLLQVGKDLIHVWTVDSPNTLWYYQNKLHIIDGVLGMFDLNNPISFNILEEQTGTLIQQFGKMYPLILLANKADLPRHISREDIMVFSYELGNCSSHRIPVFDLSAMKNIGLEAIFANLITMINCNMKNKCSEFPALARNWCTIPTEYSFHNETRQKLAVLTD